MVFLKKKRKKIFPEKEKTVFCIEKKRGKKQSESEYNDNRSMRASRAKNKKQNRRSIGAQFILESK